MTRPPVYRAAVEALYVMSYAIRAIATSQLGRVHTVGPLEGLWYADDPRVFTARDKDVWNWRMMIWQPDWITPEVVAAAGGEGDDDEEGPVIARMHAEAIAVRGAALSGHHHEIYLSDPRRVEPARLRTVLRQPVALD